MDGYLVFPSNFEYDSVDVYCDVYALGEDGFPMLKEAHLPYYTKYANYYVGLKLGDARYKAFSNFVNVRRNLTHNEQVDDFQYDKVATQGVIAQMGLANFRYRGSYGYGLNGYGLNGGIL